MSVSPSQNSSNPSRGPRSVDRDGDIRILALELLGVQRADRLHGGRAGNRPLCPRRVAAGRSFVGGSADRIVTTATGCCDECQQSKRVAGAARASPSLSSYRHVLLVQSRMVRF